MSHKNLDPTAPGAASGRHRAVQPGHVVDHRCRSASGGPT